MLAIFILHLERVKMTRTLITSRFASAVGPNEGCASSSKCHDLEWTLETIFALYEYLARESAFDLFAILLSARARHEFSTRPMAIRRRACHVL